MDIQRTAELRKRSKEVLLYKVQSGMIIYTAAESLRHMGLLLQPFMPGKAAEMLDLLGVAQDKRSFKYLGLGKDFSYGAPLRSIGISAQDAIFPPLAVED